MTKELIKEQLVKEYGEEKAEYLITKFTEDELYESGFIKEILPEDPELQKVVLTLKDEVKQLRAELEDKNKHIHNLNEENKGRRISLENESKTKQQLIEDLNELQSNLSKIEKEKQDLVSQLENYKDYSELKEYKQLMLDKEEQAKQELLKNVDDSVRDYYSQMTLEGLQKVLSNNTIPEKTPGIDNQKAPTSTDNLGGLKDLFNALKGNN